MCLLFCVVSSLPSGIEGWGYLVRALNALERSFAVTRIIVWFWSTSRDDRAMHITDTVRRGMGIYLLPGRRIFRMKI